jgi:hypothetical protein
MGIFMSAQQGNPVGRWRVWGRATAVTGLGLAVSVLTVIPSSAACNTVLSHFYDPGTEIVPSATVVCAPGGMAIHGSANFGKQSGDRWHGTTSYDYCLYPGNTPGDYFFSGTETLTGSVDGCGKGSFTWTAKGDTASGGTWQVKRGSGTGRLARASGHGTSTTTTSPTLENFGLFQGQFTC